MVKTKPTDHVQYLLPNSCHPNHIFKNVPYSLALRILRICSKKSDLDKRLEELYSMLISRNYNKNIVRNAITLVKTLDRQTHLQKVVKKTNDRIVLAITYNPKLPSLPQIVKKNWRTLAKDQNMKKIFPAPPMIAYKQPPNLRSVLCRALLPKNTHPKRKLTGMKSCNKPCNICPYIFKTNKITSNQDKKKTFDLNGLFTCATNGVIYLISCQKCPKQYVGQTGRTFGKRIMEHLNYIYHKKEATGTHFSSQNHNHNDFKVQVIEKVTPNTVTYRLEREDYWIKTLGTKVPLGLNKND